jgi:hypothetical protein
LESENYEKYKLFFSPAAASAADYSAAAAAEDMVYLAVNEAYTFIKEMGAYYAIK